MIIRKICNKAYITFYNRIFNLKNILSQNLKNIQLQSECLHSCIIMEQTSAKENSDISSQRINKLLMKEVYVST